MASNIKPQLTVITHMIFGACEDPRGLLCPKAEALDTEKFLPAQPLVADANHGIVQYEKNNKAVQ